MSETVCVVVVTYNRKKLLLECLEALRKQTRPVQGIYLIDNASTDGTPVLLLEKGYITELPPENLTEPWEKEFEIKNLTDGEIIKLHYVRMHENTGSSGGFHEGVKRGYEKGYDWLWLMDDDVEPKLNALKTLIKYTAFSKCIHPRKQYLDGEVFPLEGIINFQTGEGLNFNEISFNKGKKFTFINFGCFEGMFIHKEIIAKIGYPDKRFFICCDDTVYGFLANFYTPVIYIKDILFIKKLKIKNRISNLTLYYSLRNRFLLFKYFEQHIPFFSKKKALFRYSLFLLKVLIGIIIHDKSLKRIQIFFKAVFDGINGKYGKVF